MKVLIVTNLYPNDREPGRGIFNKQQFDELAKLCEVQIIAPIAWRPGAGRTEDGRQKTEDGGRRSEVGWIETHHPRWLAIPVIGRRWHGRFYYWGIRKLFRQICAEWQPDVVLATWAYPDAWAVSLLVGRGGFTPPMIGGVNPPLPFVVKFHGTDINAVSDSGWRLRKLLSTLERADAVVCVSRAMKERLGSIVGLIDHRHQTVDYRPGSAEENVKNINYEKHETHEKGRGPVSQFGVRQIAVIPNGIDPELFRPLDKAECRKELGWDLDKKHILFIGNLVPVKGLKYLIKAMDDLPEDVVLHVVGGSKGQIIDYRPQTIDRRPNSTFIEPQAPTQPTTQQPDNPTTSTIHRILFHGRVPHDQIPVWLNAADVFCLPSLQEGCPNVVLEALACGTPVVASNVGGIPELIDSESKGLLVLAGDPAALLAGLSKMLQREVLAVRETPRQPRTWADTAAQLYQVLRS